MQQEFTYEVERQVIHVPTIGAKEMLDDRIGYIRLDSFNNLTPGDAREAVYDLLDQGMEGLIFDLRNNTGGVMNAAVGVADIFIPDGNLVYYEDSLGRREVFVSDDDGEAANIPLVVLVNGNTASSSEIVVGAIRDTRTGVIVGETTFGKGVVQNVYTLHDGSGLVLTTGRYLTPNGNEITQDGITPDVVSDLDPDRIRQTDPAVDQFLTRMDELNEEFMELRQEMWDYLEDNDFQRDTAIDVMNMWLDNGEVPQEWLDYVSEIDTSN
jgi:carboxyl-terminal processing protease